MKNKNVMVISALIIIVVIAFISTNTNKKYNSEDKDKIKVLTSFYPMYVATANVVEGMENIDLANLTQPITGCLHDYQLTPQDMVKLETADVLVINGGGMESFLGDIENKYPNIIIINASEGIELLDAVEHEEHEEHEEVGDEKEIEEDHLEKNPHAWVSINKYMTQIKNIETGLIQYDIKNEETYNKNTENYIAKLEILNDEMVSELKELKNKEIILFHDSFVYLADEFGLDVKHVVVMESDTSLSAGEIAEVIDEVNEYNIKALFTESQYSDQIASSIAKETSAKVYILDSGVSGDMNKDSYINAMHKNLEVLKEALK